MLTAEEAPTLVAPVPVKASDAAWDGWPFTLGVAFAAVAASMLLVFVLPGLFGSHAWLQMGDARLTIHAAQYVANGGVGYVYSANPSFLPLPGYLLLLAPFVAYGGHLGLISDYPVPLARPTMFLVVAPVMFTTGAVAILGCDFLAAAMRVTRSRRRVLSIAVATLIVVPTCVVTGHPEDVLALGLAAAALGCTVRGRFERAALVLAGAVMMQPWAALLVPIVVAAAPARLRIRTLVAATALPVVTALMLLGLDFHDAFRALVLQPMQGVGQRLPWWPLSHPLKVSEMGAPVIVRVGSGPRVLAVVAALAGAWSLRRGATPGRLLALASLVLAARGVFETQVWPYYLAPAAVLLAIQAARAPARRAWVTGGLAALVFYGFAAASYEHYSLPPLLALGIMVVSLGVAFAAVRPRLWVSRPAALADVAT